PEGGAAAAVGDGTEPLRGGRERRGDGAGDLRLGQALRYLWRAHLSADGGDGRGDDRERGTARPHLAWRADHGAGFGGSRRSDLIRLTRADAPSRRLPSAVLYRFRCRSASSKARRGRAAPARCAGRLRWREDASQRNGAAHAAWRVRRDRVRRATAPSTIAPRARSWPCRGGKEKAANPWRP